MKQIKIEVEEKLKDVYKDYPEFYEEYVYVDTYYRDEDGRLVVEVRAELSYDDMINLSEEIDPIVKKYDKYAYFDMADSGILEAVLDFDEKYESLNENDNKFDYMMLDRLRTDCDYFLGYGDGCEKHLWAGNVEDQIAEMRKIYDKLPEKPEWLSIEDIDKYEKEMLAKRDSKNEVKEITRDEWNKTPKDYKMIKDGKPYLVYLDDETHATVLGPCKIIDESLDEKRVGDIVRYGGTTWVKIEEIDGNFAIVSPIYKEDIKNHRFDNHTRVSLSSLQTQSEVETSYYDGSIHSLNTNESLNEEEFKIKVITHDGKEKFYKAKNLDAAKIKFSELCIRFDDCELLKGDKVLYKYKQNESLNEDGTVSDMGVAPILPAGYDDIDDIDDIDDELFDITEGFLFPDPSEETDEDKEEEVNSLMGAAIEDIKQGEPTASEWIEDAQYVFNSIKDDTVKNRLRNKYSQYLESAQKDLANHLLQVLSKGGATLRQLQDFELNGYSDKDLSDTLKNLIRQRKVKTSFEGGTTRYTLVESQKNEASAELNKVIKDLAANDKTDVDKEINKLYKDEPEAKSNVADGSPILGATSPDNIVPTIDKAIMNKAIFAATSYANNGPQMFAKLQESFKNIDRKTIDDLMNSKDVVGIAKYLYESEMKDNKNEDTFTDPQMNVVNSNSTTVATGNSSETPKLADDIDPAPTEVQGFPKDKSEIENTNANNKEDQLAKDSGTENIPTDN